MFGSASDTANNRATPRPESNQRHIETPRSLGFKSPGFGSTSCTRAKRERVGFLDMLCDSGF